MRDVNFCLDLALSINEFQKEIDEHKITNEKTLAAQQAGRAAFNKICMGNDVPVDCKALVDNSEIWKEEIHKYSTTIPVIPLFGWACAKGPAYYARVQAGIDGAIDRLQCRVE